MNAQTHNPWLAEIEHFLKGFPFDWGFDRRRVLAPRCQISENHTLRQSHSGNHFNFDNTKEAEVNTQRVFLDAIVTGDGYVGYVTRRSSALRRRRNQKREKSVTV